MKKITSTLMAAALCASLAGCSSSGTSSSSTAASDSSSSDTYTIGIVQYIQHEALDSATQGFKDALTDELGDSVTFDEQNASGETATCATIANQFVTENVDLIMANATPALQAAVSATSDIPILGTSVTDYATALDIDDWTGTVGTNVSGTSDLAPLDQQAELFTELLPDVKTIGILYCSGEPNSAYQAKVIRQYLEDAGYEVKDDYTFADSNDLQSVATTACNECDALYIPTDNTAANNTELINNVATAAETPIIAGEEGITKGCGIATLSISYYDLGVKTGEMAIKVLNGEDISTMAIESADATTKEYVASRCEAYGITVPDDYTAIEED